MLGSQANSICGGIARTSVMRGLVSGLVGAVLMPTALGARAQSTGLRLMPLGDSITAGFRSTNGDSYRGPLYAALKTHGFVLDFVGPQRSGVMFDPDNEGYSGYRIDQVAELTNTAMATYHPNVVTLHLGTNDLGQNYQVPTAPNRLAALIDQIIAADPHVTILVAQLVCNATPAVQSLTTAFNARIPAIVETRAKAGKHVYLVSMGSLTKADLDDGLHPNDAGYQKMADAWDAVIQKVVTDGWVAPLEFAGVFEIQNQESSLVLDVSGGSTDNGATVIQWESGGNSNQLWNLIPTGHGYYQIKNTFSGLDLNVTGASKDAGAKIVQWKFGTEGNDQWLPARQSDGLYTLSNRNSGLLLTNSGGTTPGAQFKQAEARGGDSQKFKLVAR